MFGARGTSCVGTAAADAPPTSEKVNPEAPSAGTALVTRVRFEACFTRGILASSIDLVKDNKSPALQLYALRMCHARLLNLLTGYACNLFLHVYERLVHDGLLPFGMPSGTGG
jgi:hypothetical protein